MKHLALVCSFALLTACASDDSSSIEAPAATGEPAAGNVATGGRRLQAQAQAPRALGDKSQRAPSDLARSFEYYDGERERTVWLSNELVAEFAPSEQGRARVLQFDSAAELRAQPQSGVRLWRVRAAGGVDEAARAMTSEAQRFSPVLHDVASSTSPRLALPGGAVATFPAGWDRARIDAWSAAHSTRVLETVVAEANMHLLDTPPGLASIELANRFHESGELVACTPNFWREAVTR